MSGIDHTIIPFKNGMLLKKMSVRRRDGGFVSLLPFSFGRDGEIRGFELLGYDQPQNGGKMKTVLGGFFHRRGPEDKTYFFYADKDVEIVMVKAPTFCASFYLDWQNTYVLLGGYGHHQNPYVHFYNRGYGETFERKMALECYHWLCGDVLSEALLYSPAYAAEYEHHLLRLRLRLGYRDLFREPDGTPEYPGGMMPYYTPQENEPGGRDESAAPLWPPAPGTGNGGAA